MIAAPLFRARLEAIRTVSHAMSRDGTQLVLIQAQSRSSVSGSRKLQQGLKCFQRLPGTLEADQAGHEAVRGRSLSDQDADEIVSQHVRPDFLPDELG
jgi:hypothetical protein